MFYTIKDPKTLQYKNDASLAGRVLADMHRILQIFGHDGISVDLEYKCVSYNSVEAATKMLDVLVEYMKENNKSRRKRGSSAMLKSNKRPEHDGRRKTHVTPSP